MVIKHPYWTLTKFIVPLAFTTIAQDVGEQALNRSLTSSTNAVIELASFGIAYKILLLFTGCIEDVKYVSVVTFRGVKEQKKIIIFVSMFSVLALSLMLIVGLTSVGNVIINDFHDVSDEVGNKARKILYMLSVYPFLDGLAWTHTGILIKNKYSLCCGIGAISDVISQILLVIILLQTNLKNHNVELIPVIAAYFGVITRIVVLGVSYYRYVYPNLTSEGDANLSEDASENNNELTYRRILSLWAPFMIIRMVQRVSRPLVNLMVARDREDGFTQKDGVQALAVLTIIWPILHVPYGWLNETRVLEATFATKNENGQVEIPARQIRLFGFGASCLSLGAMLLLFWIPGIAANILSNVSNIDESLISLCIAPLKIASFLPIPVICRSLCTGWLLSIKRTSVLYPSGFFRLGLILTLLIVMPKLGVHGAVLGASVLIAGFLIDALSVVVAAACVKWRKAKVNNVKEERKAILDLTKCDVCYETGL